MSMTLREKYLLKKQKQLSEKLNSTDKNFLQETKITNMIIEAIEEEDLQEVEKLIDKLRSMKGKGVAALDKAISNAEADVAKYASGGIGTEFLTKIKGMVGLKNPIVKVTTFADALEQGLKQVPTILKINLGDQEFLKKNLEFPIDKILEKDAKKKKVVTDTIFKAFKPKGILSSFKNVPYVEDMSKLARDLTATPLKNLVDLVKLSSAAPTAQSLTDDVKDVATATSTGDKQTTSVTPATSTEKGEQTAPTKDTTKTTGTEEKPAPQAAEPGTKNAIDQLKDYLAGPSRENNLNNLPKVVQALIDAGLDPEKLRIDPKKLQLK